ncbi:MAG TPA: hypothetical protein VM431_12690 [Phycisphaerae bacterium]|nr:hypothetical protein [Phycisphaerae bacterium]
MHFRRHILGLAVTKRSATAVEVALAKGGARVLRTAEFVFPAETDLKEPDRLGKALKEFLQKEHFTASRCIIGLEAARLTAREKTLPPGSGDSLTEILTIAVEREFASDRKELVFDYLAGAGAAAKPSVLLVAAPRRNVEQLVAMAQGAGLTVAGVTSSTLALAASADGSPDTEHLMLHVFGGGAELVVRSRGNTLMMGRLSAPVSPQAGTDAAPAAAWLDELSHELRRVAYIRLGEPAAGQAHELLVWNETPLPPAVWDALAQRLAMPVRLCRPADGRGPADAASPPQVGQYSAAAAMALAAVQGRPLPVDFLHSRLTPRRHLTVGRKVAWAAAVAAAVVLAGAFLVIDMIQDEHDVADLEARLKENAAGITEARDVVGKVIFARGWYERRPRLLDCLRELTLAFPAEGGIWTTGLSMHEDLRGVVSGKAVAESRVLEVLDRLKTNPKFSDVKAVYLRQAGRGTREVAFAMSFRYTGSDGT